MISARSLSAVIGRPLPFNSRTDRSPFNPTASRSPSARARCKYRTCPTCSKSKQPLVATSFLPVARNLSQRSESSLRPTIFGLTMFWLDNRVARQFRSWPFTNLRDVAQKWRKEKQNAMREHQRPRIDFGCRKNRLCDLPQILDRPMSATT